MCSSDPKSSMMLDNVLVVPTVAVDPLEHTTGDEIEDESDVSDEVIDHEVTLVFVKADMNHFRSGIETTISWKRRLEWTRQLHLCLPTLHQTSYSGGYAVSSQELQAKSKQYVQHLIDAVQAVEVFERFLTKNLALATDAYEGKPGCMERSWSRHAELVDDLSAKIDRLVEQCNSVTDSMLAQLLVAPEFMSDQQANHEKALASRGQTQISLSTEETSPGAEDG